MYQLLTADDEPDKLEALRSSYDWTRYGVQRCGEAENGLDAYDQIVKKRPDICILDIRMPGISGLEAMRRAKTAGVNTKYIVLSGYDEFDYAKEALSLSTVEYLLKPCRPEDIIGAVLKSIALIEEERRQSRLLSDYRNLLEVREENRRRQFLTALLSGKPVGPMGKKLGIHRLEWLSRSAAVLLFAAPEGGADGPRDVPLQSIATAVRERLSAVCRAEVLIFRSQVAAVAGPDPASDNFDAVRRAADGALGRIAAECGLSCAAGISAPKKKAALLREAYAEAREAAEAALFLSGGGTVLFSELDRFGPTKYPDRLENGILSSLDDPELLPEAVDRFLAGCAPCSRGVKQRVQEAAITLICNAYKAGTERGVRSEDFSNRKSEAAGRVLECGGIGNVRAVLTDFLTYLAGNLPAFCAASVSAKRALAYINQNYFRRITLETVAEEVHVTPSYLSMLFKQQTGLRLIEYLNRCRIEKSKELIRAGDLKIYEIAYRVGYQDEKYFHIMFKRYTGMTATQFRDRESGGPDACIVSAK